MVRIDVSRACAELRKEVITILSARDGDVVTVEGDIKEVKKRLEQSLPEDYVVAENAQDPDELAVLKKGDLEQLGLYICSFCTMVFRSETERNMHQRVHYFGFS